jgi:hypothetical protein
MKAISSTILIIFLLIFFSISGIGYCTSKLQALDEKVSILEQENADLQAALINAQNTNTEQKNTIERLNQENTNVQNDLANANQTIIDYKTDYTALWNELQSTKTILTSVSESEQQCLNQIESLTRKAEENSKKIFAEPAQIVPDLNNLKLNNLIPSASIVISLSALLITVATLILLAAGWNFRRNQKSAILNPNTKWQDNSYRKIQRESARAMERHLRKM